MPTVRIPPPYRGPTGGEASVEVEGATVRQCLEAVGSRFPGFREQVLDGSGRAHRFVSLFVNGQEIDREALDKPLSAADELEILAAIAGG